MAPGSVPPRILSVGGHHHDLTRSGVAILRRFPAGTPFPTEGALEASHLAHFHLPVAVQRLGRLEANRALLDFCLRERPDAAHVGAVWYELLPSTLLLLRHAGVFTIGHRDSDHMNFWSYARFLHPLYDFMVTNDRRVKTFYDTVGKPSFLHPFAQTAPIAAPGPRILDVAYVGHAMNGRVEAMRALRERGIHVTCWGPGWIAHEDLFGAERGGIRFDPETGALAPDQVARAYTLARIGIDLSGFDGSRAILRNRDFEIPLSGALLVTYPKHRLDECFVPGAEVVVARTLDEAASSIRTLLNDPARLGAIAEAGHRRALREHSGEGTRHRMWEGIAPHLAAARAMQGAERLARGVSDACRAVLLQPGLCEPLGRALAVAWSASDGADLARAQELLRAEGVSCRLDGDAGFPILRVLRHAPLEAALRNPAVAAMALSGAATPAA
ncbi:MAG: glycosyltransferase [Planctomycetes bacterium]|nr:glycosyltransferase [Planctomycetota bacterium]